MSFQPVLLWSDVLLWLLVLAIGVLGFAVRRDPLMRQAWRKVGESRNGMAAATVLSVFVLVGLADSLHYRAQLPARAGEKAAYAVEVNSLLDALASPLRLRNERTYSAPLATRAYAKEMVDLPDGRQVREFPRLRHGGAHLADEAAATADILRRAAVGAAGALLVWGLLAGVLVWWLARRGRVGLGAAWGEIWDRRGAAGPYAARLATGGLAWDAVLLTLALVFLSAGLILALAGHYHLFGTDKVGQDVLYQVLKSVRTALIIGLVTTLVTLPLGVVLGVAAGYFRGWVDDVIQYIYTTLNSIPSVLLIAAAVLMMQTLLDTHPQWFATVAERADLRLLALCLILGITSWTGLARLLRGETLKLAQLEYVQAAQAFGVSSWRILLRHLLPNLMHIVIIAMVMDFSGLVLAEAVLSYVGVGVDPTMTSFGTMINNARMELGREPAVWWSLAGAFVFMFILVLAANLFADAVRDAFDPRFAGVGR